MIPMSLSSALATTRRKVWFCFSHLVLVLQIIEEVFAFYNTDFYLLFFFSFFLKFFIIFLNAVFIYLLRSYC